MKQKKSGIKGLQPASRLRGWATKRNVIGLVVGVVLLLGLVAGMVAVNRPDPDAVPSSASLLNYVPARVTRVVSDDATPDTWTDGRRLGTQVLEVAVLSGPYKGTHLTVQNFLNAYDNVDAKAGTRLIVHVDVDEAGALYAVAVTGYDRGLILAGLVLVFMALLIIIGGKKGLMALLGLAFTLICLWFLLIPLMLRGVPPIPITIAVVVLTAAVSLLLLDGPSRKSLCAILGCAAGVAAAGLGAALVGELIALNGFNMSEAEGLLLVGSDQGLSISGLLVCGILISSLGAVMDVSMSIASASHELRQVDPAMTAGALFRSGMNIGRDAMGTMANTLILAFVGSSLNMLLLFQVYQYPTLQLLNSDLMSIEILQGVAGSIGIVLTVPAVAAISARIMTRTSPRPAPSARFAGPD